VTLSVVMTATTMRVGHLSVRPKDRPAEPVGRKYVQRLKHLRIVLAVDADETLVAAHVA
jgi:hypothetical protein